MLEGNPELLDAMGLGAGAGGALIDAFLGYINLSLGVIGAVFGVASVMRLRAEEDAGRAEWLLSTPLSRTGWLAGSLAVTILGSALVALAMGLGMVLGYLPVAGSLDSGTGPGVAELVLGLFAQLPAMLLVAAAAFFLLAWAPRLALLAWMLVTWVVLEVFLGETLRLPDSVRALSPFFHLPVYPTEPWTARPALGLLAVTVVLLVLGLQGYRRRDVA